MLWKILLLEPVSLVRGMNAYRRTFGLSIGETLVTLFKCSYFLWLCFPVLLPFYIIWPSLLQKFKNKFSSQKLMSFYNSPFYWSHLIPHEFSLPKQQYVKHILGLISEFNGRQGLRILEVGSGVGSYTVHLSKANEVTTLDLSKPSLRLIRFRVGKNVNTFVSSAGTLPFSGPYFDIIVCMDVLEHIANPKVAVLELMRTLNGNRSILIANYDIETIEKDHIGQFSELEFEDFLAQHFRVKKKVTFDVGSPVYVIGNKGAS